VRAGYAVEEGRGDTQMTLDAMRAHIDRLIANLRVTRFHFADDLDIRWIDDREEAMAITDADPVEIHLPHIRSTLDYATCLHELGHVNGRYQIDLINTARVGGFIITDKVSRYTLSKYQCLTTSPPKKPTIRCRPIGATSTRVEKEGDGFEKL